MYGHIEIMAKAIAEGVRSANADVVIKRVSDTMSSEVAKQYGAKLSRRRRLRGRMNFRNTMPSSLALPRDSGTWPDRCGTFSTRQEACGSRGPSLVKLEAFLSAPAQAAGMSQLF